MTEHDIHYPLNKYVVRIAPVHYTLLKNKVLLSAILSAVHKLTCVNFPTKYSCVMFTIQRES